MCRFSIIIVCKNEEKNIRKTLNSVLQQKFTDFECIVMDGLSDDKTCNILYELKERDSRIKVYSQKDLGIYDAMNKGIKKAGGEYIYFLNAKDTFYNENVLEYVDTILEKETDILIGRVCVRERLEPLSIGVESLEKMWELVKGARCICHQAMVVKRECLENGFDLQYRISADYDWFCKQLIKNKRIQIVQEIIANYASYGFSAWVKNRKFLWEEADKICKKHFATALSEEMSERRFTEYRRGMINQMTSEWLLLKQREGSLAEMVKGKGVKKVAIYGFSRLGIFLYHELKNQDVQVMYAIDKSDLSWRMTAIDIFTPEDELPQVDAVIITPILDYYEIKENMMRKMDCQYLSLEDLINEAFEELENSVGENNVI